MLPRKDRASRNSFPEISRSGTRVESPHFSAVISEKANGYAVVVSKKTARLSVTRHKIKRRVSSALRGIKLPKSAIIYPKSSALHLQYECMQTELAGLLSRTKPYPQKEK